MNRATTLDLAVPGRVTVHTPDNIQRDLKVWIPGLLRVDVRVTRGHVSLFDTAVVARFGSAQNPLALTFTPTGFVLGSGPSRRGRIGFIAPPLPGTNTSYLETYFGRVRFADRLREELQGITSAEYDIGDGSFSRFRLSLHATVVSVAIQLRGNRRSSLETVVQDISPQSGGRVEVFQIAEKEALEGQSKASSEGTIPTCAAEGSKVVTEADFESWTFSRRRKATRPMAETLIGASIGATKTSAPERINQRGEQDGAEKVKNVMAAPPQRPRENHLESSFPARDDVVPSARDPNEWLQIAEFYSEGCRNCDSDDGLDLPPER